MESCNVIVYKNGTIEKSVLVYSTCNTAGPQVGRAAEEVFLRTLSEELNGDYKEFYTEDEIQDALDEGRIELDSGVQIYIVHPMTIRKVNL